MSDSSREFKLNREGDDFFNVNIADAKLIVPRIIRGLIRDVNLHKLDHGTLRYIYRQVIERCELSVPQVPKRLYRLPTQEDLDRFFAVIDDPVHRLIFEVLSGTGLREAELCKLVVSKIDFQKNTALVNGKGNKDRLVILSERLKQKVMLYLANRDNRYLFESNRGTKFSTRRIQQICAHYRCRADLEVPLTPHTFRHLFNTRLAEAGVSKEYRKLLAGHSSDASQDIYTHLGLAGISTEILSTLEKLGL